jgi:hypothetical protein
MTGISPDDGVRVSAELEPPLYRPEDPELAALYDEELYGRHLHAAREAVRLYPDAAARVLAEAWLRSKQWLGHAVAPT